MSGSGADESTYTEYAGSWNCAFFTLGQESKWLREQTAGAGYRTDGCIYTSDDATLVADRPESDI
jgi:hypothetical protein